MLNFISRSGILVAIFVFVLAIASAPAWFCIAFAITVFILLYAVSLSILVYDQTEDLMKLSLFFYNNSEFSHHEENEQS